MDCEGRTFAPRSADLIRCSGAQSGSDRFNSIYRDLRPSDGVSEARPCSVRRCKMWSVLRLVGVGDKRHQCRVSEGLGVSLRGDIEAIEGAMTGRECAPRYSARFFDLRSSVSVQK